MIGDITKMNNIFPKSRVAKGVRMYSSIDGKHRYFGEDIDYFLSYNLWLTEEHYTICGAGSKFYSWATLDMYGATVNSGYCNGEFVQIDKTNDIKYLVVCGLESDLSTLMVLDAPMSEVGTNPTYKPCSEDEGGGGGGSTNASASLLASDFVWDEDITYTIHSFVDSNISSISDLPDEFMVYINSADHIVAGARINLFGSLFEVEHINGKPVTVTLRAVPRVLPLMFSKLSNKARMIYSYTATVQTGLGLEDIFIDIEDEEPNSNI